MESESLLYNYELKGLLFFLLLVWIGVIILLRTPLQRVPLRRKETTFLTAPGLLTYPLLFFLLSRLELSSLGFYFVLGSTATLFVTSLWLSYLVSNRRITGRKGPVILFSLVHIALPVSVLIIVSWNPLPSSSF